MKPATLKQPNPTPGGVPALPVVSGRYGLVYPAIVADIKARAKVGLETYGVEGVHVPDGRDHGIDAYQEALDAPFYLVAWAMAAPEGSPARARRLAIADHYVAGAALIRDELEAE